MEENDITLQGKSLSLKVPGGFYDWFLTSEFTLEVEVNMLVAHMEEITPSHEYIIKSSHKSCLL